MRHWKEDIPQKHTSPVFPEVTSGMFILRVPKSRDGNSGAENTIPPRFEGRPTGTTFCSSTPVSTSITPTSIPASLVDASQASIFWEFSTGLALQFMDTEGLRLRVVLAQVELPSVETDKDLDL